MILKDRTTKAIFNYFNFRFVRFPMSATKPKKLSYKILRQTAVSKDLAGWDQQKILFFLLKIALKPAESKPIEIFNIFWLSGFRGNEQDRKKEHHLHFNKENIYWDTDGRKSSTGFERNWVWTKIKILENCTFRNLNWSGFWCMKKLLKYCQNTTDT